MPQTKHQLQELLEGAGITPRRQWGQHFLIDLNLMRLLVDKAELKGTETVLEVGCGSGSLTELLAERAGVVVAVEIDAKLADIARVQLHPYKNVALFCADVLARKSAIEPKVLAAVKEAQERLRGGFFLIANLPYQVAAPLVLNLIMGQMVPEAMHITVQAEVAQRMAAKPGTKAYGLLSIMLQATGQVSWLRRIKPTSFWPVPNVYSAMISWRRSEEKWEKIGDIDRLKETADMLLQHRRKQIQSCLAKSLSRDNIACLLAGLGINGNIRAETLAPEKFVELAKARHQ